MWLRPQPVGLVPAPEAIAGGHGPKTARSERPPVKCHNVIGVDEILFRVPH